MFFYFLLPSPREILFIASDFTNGDRMFTSYADLAFRNFPLPISHNKQKQIFFLLFIAITAGNVTIIPGFLGSV
jgi:hypothetical protein